MSLLANATPPAMPQTQQGSIENFEISV